MKKSVKTILKQLIEECLQELNESMTLSVVDADYTRYDTLMNLSSHLEKSLYKIIEKLPKDRQAYFSKNRKPDLLTIDGLEDVDSPTGTLNLYCAGLMNDTILEFGKAIVAELKRLNIRHGVVRTEQSRMYDCKVVRIPITENKNEYKGAPEINMSNRNAYHIVKNILQFEPDDDSGGTSFTFTPEELKERIEAILQHDPEWIAQNKIHKHDTSRPDKEQDLNTDHNNPHDDIIKNIAGNARVISMGLSEEDIKQRLIKVLEVANYAIKNKKKLAFS